MPNSIIDALGFDSEIVRCRFDNNVIKGSEFEVQNIIA
jgi:hypothetical protein